MNESILKGKWKQLKGSFKKQWGELADDDLDKFEGNGLVLSGKIQEKYGESEDEVEHEIRIFEKGQQ